jgi:Ca2+-binding RTX toxin-like protein
MQLVRIAALALASFALPVVTAPAGAAAPVRCHQQVATIIGTAGADHIVGTEGDDVIAALGGADRVEGLGGQDVICGGNGNDVLLGGDATDRLSGQQGNDRLVGGDGNRAVLDGGPGDDLLTSSATRVSRLFGRSGDDVLRAGSSELILSSEPGDDTITTTLPGASVILDARAAPVGIRFDAPRSLLAGRGHTDLQFAPRTGVFVQASSHDDVLVGTPGQDALAGNGGDDLIRGVAGADRLSGGAGTNLLRGGSGPDVISEDIGAEPSGRQMVYGGKGSDLIRLHRRDSVHGGRGDDMFAGMLLPGPGQVVDGGSGFNGLRVRLGAPSDGSSWAHVLIDLGRGLVDADGHSLRLGGLFTDLVLRPDQNQVVSALTLAGTAHADSIVAFRESADVEIRGRGGDDLLRTDTGDDTIHGGNGNDTADAGAGTDTCRSVETPTNCESSTP